MWARTGSDPDKIPAQRALRLTGNVAVPLPHPLDFDWRFTPETIALVWQIIRHLANPGGGVALLGTPSLVVRVDPDAHFGSISLFERNPLHCPSLADGVTFIGCDVLCDPIEPGDNSVVVADPPWYEAETTGFLWTASRLSRAGGYTVLSMPPVSTRPGIKQERDRVKAAAAEFGLELLGIFEAILRYQTPFFETNAMRAAGTATPNHWRLGDLGVFRRTERVSGLRPTLDTEPPWAERSIGLTRFRLRPKQSIGFPSPELRSIVPGDILPSVSRRDPRRANADVWTSGNRIFACGGTSTLVTIIDALAARQMPEVAVEVQEGRTLAAGEAALVATAAQQVQDVVKWESAEFRNSGTLDRISKLGPIRDQPTTLDRTG